MDFNKTFQEADYSDDSLIRAPIVRKSRLSGQKVWEQISTSELMGDSIYNQENSLIWKYQLGTNVS